MKGNDLMFSLQRGEALKVEGACSLHDAESSMHQKDAV